MAEVLAQSAPNFAMVTSRSAQNEVPVAAFGNFVGGFAQALEPPVPESSARKKAVETAREFVHYRTGHAQTEVAPAAGDSITLVFVCDIEAADVSDTIVDDHDLAMIPVAPAFDRDRIKPGELSTSIHQRIPKSGREADGAERIYEQVDLDAPSSRLHQGFAELF